MSVVTLEDDDSSDDIFIIKRIKPVNKLTLQQALIIKHGVLTSRSNKKLKKKKHKAKELRSSSSGETKSNTVDIEIPGGKLIMKEDKETNLNSRRIFSKSLRTSGSNNVHEGTKKNNEENEVQQCCSESEIKQESKSVLSAENFLSASDICTNTSIKNHKMSSSISNKRKEISDASGEIQNATQESTRGISSENKGSVRVKNEIKSEENFHDSVDADFSLNFLDNNLKSELMEDFSNGLPSSHMVNTFQELEEEKFKNNTEILTFLLKNIISDETKKQIYLEERSKSTGKEIEKLFTETECQVLEKFFKLNENASQVFVRMLCRKKYWHRVSNINFRDINCDLENEFQVLHKENFVDVNIEEEDIETQLNLLRKSELLQLCKGFNIVIKNTNLTKKSAVDLLIKDGQKQMSISAMFKRKKSTDRIDLLKSKVKSLLGMCIKLSKVAFEAFYKIFLLSSFPYYTEEEEEEHRFSNVLYLNLQVYKNLTKFPNYTLTPTVVFENRSDFVEYKNALVLLDCFKSAINTKNHDEFLLIFNKAKEEFERLLRNYEYHKRFSSLKPFLQKFSAGTIYARILSLFCTNFKKKTCSSEIIITAQLLLDQNLFLTRKRGEWYDILSTSLGNERKYDLAAQVIITALNDPLVSVVQKLCVQLRGQSILKRKNSITDIKLREVLDDFCTLSVQEPPSIEINGKALDIVKVTLRSVYVQDCEGGKIYTSVEERAISYYKSTGFTKGYHVEGYIVQSLYFLLFYDIIYATSVKDVFLSPFQEAPLDFYSASFYENRKAEIDQLLEEMLSWDNLELESKIKDAYSKNYKTNCLIKWDDNFTPDLFCEVSKCITLPILVLIFQRLILNFRVFRSGFPDLTLWNPQTHKCKFVEVKSPNDRLSPAQRIWLDYLRSIGLDCEVCNVKNISGRSLQ